MFKVVRSKSDKNVYQLEFHSYNLFNNKFIIDISINIGRKINKIPPEIKISIILFIEYNKD